MIDLMKIADERLAIVGGTGSGKSFCARGLVERVLLAGGRVGVIDPTGVWYGLRVDADGKKPGFPLVVFGGDHGDLPLVETGGRVVAQAVATSSQSWIIDTSALKTKAAERRFMLDFLDALFVENRADLTLVVDEADRFSPQRMSPETTRLHERMEEIVRRGRVRGIKPWLITQRPASLNKDVLSQATAMICLRMTGVHDRKALEATIEGQADKATAKAIVDEMPRHKVGSGIVWAPQQDILEAVTFPKIVTLDTMRAPKAGEARLSKSLPPIDLGVLREKLATVEEETKANDPKALKARIAELEREKASAKGVLGASEADLKKEYERGYRDGAKDTSIRDAASVAAGLEYVESARTFFTSMQKALKDGLVPHGPARQAFQPVVTSRVTPAPVVPRPIVPSGTNGSLPKAERLILTVLAQREPERVSVDRIAAIAGYAAGGGGFNNSLSSLRGKGYIEPGSTPGITGLGLAALGNFEPLPTGAELARYWMGKVGKAERSVLEALQHGRCAMSKEEIANAAGYAADGGGFNNALSRLRTLGLITGRGEIELHEDLR